MKRLLRTIIIPVVALLSVSGCDRKPDKNDIEASLAYAERAIVDGEVTVATEVGNHLFGDEGDNGLAVSQLGRLSMVYMRVAEQTDQQENVDKALALYRKAFELDADSAYAFYSNVSPELTADVALLAALASQQDFVYTGDEHADSVEPDTLPTDNVQ